MNNFVTRAYVLQADTMVKYINPTADHKPGHNL
jgi:hypothetical protein